MYKPTRFVIQSDHSMLVDIGHIMDDVLWVHITLVDNLIKRCNAQNPLQAETQHTSFSHSQPISFTFWFQGLV